MSIMSQFASMAATYAPLIAPAVTAANVVKIANAVPQALNLIKSFTGARDGVVAPQAASPTASAAVEKLTASLQGNRHIPRRAAVAISAAFILLAAGGNSEPNINAASRILSNGLVQQQVASPLLMPPAPQKA